MKNKKAISSILLTFLIIIGVVAVAFVASLIIEIPVNSVESYTDKEPSVEHYRESVPYNDQDCNDANMIYKISWYNGGQTSSCLQQECASYNQVCTSKNWLGNCISYSPQCASYKCVKYNNHCVLTVENKESQQLNLELQVQKYNRDTKNTINIAGYDTEYYISPLDSSTISWDFVSEPPESMGCIYDTLNNPTKTICTPVIRYRDEDRTRTIYTDTTKYRDVIKYCKLFNRVIGNCR